MSFKRSVWFPIAVGLAVLNVAGAIYALLMSEPMHAFAHGAVTVAAALWARYLRQPSAMQLPSEDAKVQMLEANLSELERQLLDTQERLEFADQLLKHRKETE